MDSSPLRCDLLIVGGGPAGATLGTLVKKYNPSARVVIAEMERFPRHHIGESLLPAVPPILREMGVFEKIDSVGFLKKLGNAYVWGASRKPWVADFEGLTFEQQLAMGWKPSDPLAYCWQVRRSHYDQILLKHAQDSGVEVLPARAVGILEDGNRIIGAKLAVKRGTEREVRCRLLADCSGQNGFLSQFRSIRRFDKRLRNVALYAYFKGAEWHTRFEGHPDKTRTFLCSVEGGWFWYIQIGPDLVSVGLVTTHDHLQARNIKDLRAYYKRKIADCPEVAKLLKNARQETDFDGSGKDFFVVKDWSYLCDEAAGPGWLAAGDAAVFVDPVFSSGVTVAHLSAQRAAYTITKAWKGISPALERALWRDYSAFARDCAAVFLIMALYWYRSDRSQRGLWKKAAELYQARLPQSLSDFSAYLAVISGVLAPAERLVGFDLERPHGEDFFRGICDRKAHGEITALSRRNVADGATPRLTCPFSVELAFLPDPKSGSLKDAVRIRFAKHPETDGFSGVLNPRMVVSPIRLELIKSFDGARTLGEIKAGLAARNKIDRSSVDIEAAGLLRQLLLWKVVETRKPAGGPAGRRKKAPAGSPARRRA